MTNRSRSEPPSLTEDLAKASLSRSLNVRSGSFFRPSTRSGRDESPSRRAGSMSSAARWATSAAMGSAPSCEGVRTTQRQPAICSSSSSSAMAGSTPARASEDLPLPLAPDRSRKAQPSRACSLSAWRASRISSSRPKNTGACRAWKASSPRKGGPSLSVSQMTSVDSPAIWSSSPCKWTRRRWENVTGRSNGKYAPMLWPDSRSRNVSARNASTRFFCWMSSSFFSVLVPRRVSSKLASSRRV